MLNTLETIKRIEIEKKMEKRKQKGKKERRPNTSMIALRNSSMSVT